MIKDIFSHQNMYHDQKYKKICILYKDNEPIYSTLSEYEAYDALANITKLLHNGNKHTNNINNNNIILHVVTKYKYSNYVRTHKYLYYDIQSNDIKLCTNMNVDNSINNISKNKTSKNNIPMKQNNKHFEIKKPSVNITKIIKNLKNEYKKINTQNNEIFKTYEFDDDNGNDDDTDDSDLDMSIKKLEEGDKLFNVNDDLNIIDEMDKLDGMRHGIKQSIEQDKKILDNINEQLNEELFKDRCRKQDERQKERKRQEYLSIFRSDKNTYLQFKDRISRDTLDESNISLLFQQKYYIIKFMDDNKLVCFNNNESLEKEYDTYECINHISKHLGNGDDNDRLDDDFIDNMGDDNRLVCEKFMDYIDNNNIILTSADDMHRQLNKETAASIFTE